MSGQIFISYRREDSHGVAGRLYDRLESHFGRDRIFMDVDTIQPGMDFVKAIEGAVGATNVFLVVIGPAWLTAADATGNRRLENPEDFVRLEVAAALERDVRVIPVLVDRAMMPRSTDLPDDLKPLTRRNAIELSHTRFNMDAERLIRALEQAFEQLEPEPTAAEKAAAERQMAIKAEAERLASETVEAEHKAAEKAEAERIAREKARAERLAQKKAQLAERLAARKAEAGRIAAVWLSILLTTICWAIGGVIGGAIGGAIGGVIGSGIAKGIGRGIGMTIFTIFSGAIVGFVLGIVLRHTERGDWWKQVFIASIGAAIGAAIGVAIGMAIGGEDINVWAPWALGGPTVGVIGSGVIYWLRNRSRRNA